MDRLVQQLNLTAKIGTRKLQDTVVTVLNRIPHRSISHKILNFLDIRLNEEETICLFLWLFNEAFSAFNTLRTGDADLCF